MDVSWIEVNKEALLHNIHVHKQFFAPLDVAFVIKGNGYGHDMQLIAEVCELSNDVQWLCVASLSEALLLRLQGITKSLLVLSIIDASFQEAAKHNIDVVVHTQEQLNVLMNGAETFIKPLRVHIKVDTGLSRLGWRSDQIQDALGVLTKISTVHIVGIFTHLSDRNNDDLVHKQVQGFSAIINCISALRYEIPLRHITGTQLIKDNPGLCTMVRIGLGMYGISYDESSKALPLKLVMTWKAKIIQIKEVQAGAFVSYGNYKRLDHNAMIAIIPVGYCDGYPLSLSNKGYVSIQGQLAPILGRVTMNLIIVDVSHIPNITINDYAFILADHPQINPHDIALKAETIPYEIITGISRTIPRILIEKL